MSRDDPPRRGRPYLYEWTSEREAELIARLEQRESQKAIAYSFGWPPHAVMAHVERLRAEGRSIASRQWSRRESLALVAAREAGARWAELAPIFRRPPPALRAHCSQFRRRLRAEAEQADRDQFTLELRAA